MFKIKLGWDGFGYPESYHHYEYAVKAFESYSRISKVRKANGQIDGYHIELIEET